MSVEIVQGEDKIFTVDVKKSDGDAFDLTGFTDLTAEFKLAAGGALSLTTAANGNGSVVTSPNPTCGRIQVSIDKVDTALLESGDSQDIEIIIEDGSNELTILQLSGQMKVKERLIS